jgi:site-specific DNA-methyltransferase (adenine-specific)
MDKITNTPETQIAYSECYAQVFLGDCLEIMPQIESKSIDLILCDLPYGITNNKWDIVLPLKELWKEYERLISDNGNIVLTSQQPFTTDLINVGRSIFKYDIVWDKVGTSGFLNAKRQPLKRHEIILIFSKSKNGTYNPQKTLRTEKEIRRGWKDKTYSFIDKKYEKSNYGEVKQNVAKDYEYDKKHPNTIISYSVGNGWIKKKNVHPTQKPIELMQYLIKTYSNENNMVLDNCMGSGTTGLACKNTNRSFIGIEKDENYFKIAEQRINARTLFS